MGGNIFGSTTRFALKHISEFLRSDGATKGKYCKEDGVVYHYRTGKYGEVLEIINENKSIDSDLEPIDNIDYMFLHGMFMDAAAYLPLFSENAKNFRIQVIPNRNSVDRTKFRKLCGTNSLCELTENQINEYIKNTADEGSIERKFYFDVHSAGGAIVTALAYKSSIKDMIESIIFRNPLVPFLRSEDEERPFTVKMADKMLNKISSIGYSLTLPGVSKRTHPLINQIIAIGLKDLYDDPSGSVKTRKHMRVIYNALNNFEANVDVINDIFSYDLKNYTIDKRVLMINSVPDLLFSYESKKCMDAIENSFPNGTVVNYCGRGHNEITHKSYAPIGAYIAKRFFIDNVVDIPNSVAEINSKDLYDPFHIDDEKFHFDDKKAKQLPN